MDNRNTVRVMILLCISVIFLFIMDIMLGPVRIPLQEVVRVLFFGNTSKLEWTSIILDFRIPKAITAVLAGIALSVSGLQMQTVFRNPLAGPYVLGISSGASLGVAIVILGYTSLVGNIMNEWAGKWLIVLASWVGSGMVLLLIMSVSVRIKDIMTILILGMMFGSIISAIVSALQYFSNEAMLKSFVIWTMGSVSNVSGNQIYLFSICIIGGVVISLLSVKYLNMLLLGENYAQTLGLNIKMARFIIFLSTSILTGTVTAFCGPIGFIGIAVPHLCRMLLKTGDQKILLLSSILAGASVMLLSDMFSLLPGKGMVLPLNTVTAIIGIPIVIYIIMRNKSISTHT
jgi:iron complex transport system permease protein